MQLDNRTLALVLVGICLILATALAANAISVRRFRGQVAWAAGTFTLAISFALLASQGLVPDFFGVVLANAGLMAGACLIWFGLDAFQEIRRPRALYIAVPVVHVAGISFFSYVVDSANARITIFSAIYALVVAMASFALFSKAPRRKRLAYRATGALFAAFALYSAIRVAQSLFLPRVSNLFATGAFLTLSLIAAQVAVLATSLGLLLVTKARFELELEGKIALLERTVATRDKLFSVIAHDLRGPIGGMANLLDVLQRDRAAMEPERVAEFIEALKTSSWSTSQLLENLLMWSLDRQGELRFAPSDIPLRPAVDECAATLEPILRSKRITLANEVPADVGVFADENLLKAVLRNLISNAAKFSHREGVVSVRSLADSAGAFVIVRDEGVGMDEATLERLRSGSLDASASGTAGERGSGIGLSMCRDFMERHGGSLAVASAVARGSEVTLFFPRAAGGPKGASRAPN